MNGSAMEESRINGDDLARDVDKRSKEMIWIPAFVFFQVLLVGLWLSRQLQLSASSTAPLRDIECPNERPNLAPSQRELAHPIGKESILTSGHNCEVISLSEYREKKEREEKEREEARLLEDISYLKAVLAQIPGEPTVGPFPSFSHDLWDVESWLDQLTSSGSYEMSDFSGYPNTSPMQDEET